MHSLRIRLLFGLGLVGLLLVGFQNCGQFAALPVAGDFASTAPSSSVPSQTPTPAPPSVPPTGDPTKPVPFTNNIGFNDVKKLSLGRFQTCSLSNAGSVDCAGIGFTSAAQPKRTLFASGVSDLILNGGYGGCAILSSGALKCWTVRIANSAVQDVLSDGVKSFVWGYENRGWAVKTDGSVWQIQLLYQTNRYFYSPVQVIASGAASVAASVFGAVVLMTDGRVMAQQNTDPFVDFASETEKLAFADNQLCVLLTDHSTIRCGYLANGPSGMSQVYKGNVADLFIVRGGLWIQSGSGALIDANRAETLFDSNAKEPMWIYDSMIKDSRYCVVQNEQRLCWGANETPKQAVASISSVRDQYASYNVCVVKLDGTAACGGMNEYGESDPTVFK